MLDCDSTPTQSPSILHRFIGTFSGVAFAILLGLAFSIPAQAQNIFSVDDTGDQQDADVTDDICATNGGKCTLRAAIMQANATTNDAAGPDEIRFDGFGTAPQEINVKDGNGQLPSITDPVLIRGEEAPGTGPGQPPSIIVNGGNLSSGFDGLEIGTGGEGTEVRTLSIVGVPNYAIYARVHDVVVTGNYVGLEEDGTTINANNTGIVVTGDNASVTDNVVSGNSSHGVLVEATGTEIDNNLIGTTAGGGTGAGNGGDGIRVNAGGETIIGSGGPGNGNVISDNTGNGIHLAGAGSAKVRSNRIGTTSDGTSALGNGMNGVYLLSGSNLIGDDASTSGTTETNLISGNAVNGILLGNNSTPVSADNNTVVHNIIGLNESSGSTIPNGGGGSNSGVFVDLGASNQIEDNVISGNDTRGITIRGDNSVNNVIASNFVGTNRSFENRGNEGFGIWVKGNVSSSSEANRIGTSSSGSGNIVGYNFRGIRVEGSHHIVKRNYIGTNSSGDDLGQSVTGLVAKFASSIVLGGGNGNGNTVGFQGQEGIRVAYSSYITIQGNYVGTTASGDVVPNGNQGIRVVGSSQNNNVIGYAAGNNVPTDPSPSAGNAGNLVANNGSEGITIENGATGTSVRGNLVRSNTSLGVDLGADGMTANDDADPATADDDDGENRLQNFPVIQSTSYDSGTNTVTVSYSVPSEPGLTDSGTSTYPLQVDFYRADGDSEEGEAYLSSDEYSLTDHTGGPSVTVSFTPNASVSTSDKIVATATDANGNTSEFSSASSKLPVEIASFQATQTGSEAVELVWETASETNNSGFRVQHQGPNSDSWSKVGFIEGEGTTTESQSYRFSASDLELGTHRFRLEQVDLDGTTHVIDPVTVDLQMKQAVRFAGPAPNPVRDQATLSFAVREASQTTISVYNTLGQKVATLYNGTPQAGQSNTVRMDAEDLSSGTYFIRLNADGRTETQSMTVVR